ncbi:unnamed protein product, partial [Prorocentrum cordatum]
APPSREPLPARGESEPAAGEAAGGALSASFDRSASALAAWVEHHGSLPKQQPAGQKFHPGGVAQQRLARFLSGQAMAYSKGALRGQRLERLLQIPGVRERLGCRGETEARRAFDEGVAELKAWAERSGRLPRSREESRRP